ncbi:MAG: NAD-dependent epimerase/dehydratase family protein [Planctomycetota bacterium]
MAEARVDWNALHGRAFAGKRCLVTGGLGFIGGHLTEALAGLGATVVILDNASGGNDRSYVDAAFHLADITDAEACAEAVTSCDVVFHCAAKVSVPASVNDPSAYHDVDATGTLNVLQAARSAGVERVVYSASSSAYGDSQTLPKVESMPSMPMSPYAAAKLAGEGYCRAYAACYEIDAVSLRYFNVFGPRQNANSAYAGVIAAFARDLVAGKRPTIFGDGSASRDFTHVDNVVHANLLAARHETPLGGDVFNVGTGQRVTVSELARKMASVLDRDDLEPRFQPPRTGDVPHSQAGLDKPTAVLDYEPIVSFERGLKETVAWYRAQAAE